jgi:hypothetical protein
MATSNGAQAGGCEPVFLPLLRLWSNYLAQAGEQMQALAAGPPRRGAGALAQSPAAIEAGVTGAPDLPGMLERLRAGQEIILARLTAIEQRVNALEMKRKGKRRG